jgi:hypothetical protein
METYRYLDRILSLRFRDACRWLLTHKTVSRCSQDAEHPTGWPILAIDRDWLIKSDLPTEHQRCDPITM